MSKLIYFASPYSSDDATIRERRVRQVTEATANLIERDNTIVYFSPIVHSHPLSELLPQSTNTWDFWKTQDITFVAKCDEVWVLMLEGWQESTGVTAEIELAFQLNKTICYINYPDLSEAHSLPAVTVGSKLEASLSRIANAPAIRPAPTSFIEKNAASLDLTVGNRDDGGKPRIDLIPSDVITELAMVLTIGAQKYDDNNWRKGMKFGRCFASLNRHLWKYWNGQENDDETGLSHLAHVICNAAFLLVYSKNKKYESYDDRPFKVEVAQ